MGTWGVGMPTSLKLDEFANHVWATFGERPYMVGSATRKITYRDVDVRIILPDKAWSHWFPNMAPMSTEACWHGDPKWRALVLAFSELGRQMTGLPIDFQVQPATYAGRMYPGPRYPLGNRFDYYSVPKRMKGKQK